VTLFEEGQVEAVKMEGGVRIREQVKAVVAAGIPVLGHVGLTPQTATALGGFRVQGKSADAAKRLLDDALELQSCGVFGLVIESVPHPVATHITRILNIPTIGIGAGPGKQRKKKKKEKKSLNKKSE
jgi:3-methyl-2-oxobutanoate hydroxymethyltransferase